MHCIDQTRRTASAAEGVANVNDIADARAARQRREQLSAFTIGLLTSLAFWALMRYLRTREVAAA
jgi:hypothetical protein